MKKEAPTLTGDELNARLDALMLAIERTAILLEDAKLDENDALPLDAETRAKLAELMADYDAFLGLLRNTTEDTVAAIRRLTTNPDNPCCSFEDDRDADIDLNEDTGE